MGATVRIAAGTGSNFPPKYSNGFDRALVLVVGPNECKVKLQTAIDMQKSLWVPNELIREFQGSCGIDELNSRGESRIQRKKLNIATNDLKKELDGTKRFLSENDKEFQDVNNDLHKSRALLEESYQAQIEANITVENLRVTSKSEKQDFEKKIAEIHGSKQEKSNAVQAKKHSKAIRILNAKFETEQKSGAHHNQIVINQLNAQHQQDLTNSRLSEKRASEKATLFKKQVEQLEAAENALRRGDPNDPSLCMCVYVCMRM